MRHDQYTRALENLQADLTLELIAARRGQSPRPSFAKAARAALVEYHLLEDRCASCRTPTSEWASTPCTSLARGHHLFDPLPTQAAAAE